MKTLWHKIIEIYPQLTNEDFDPIKGTILLQNDGDEFGDYIAKWDFNQPIPDGLKLGK